MMQLRSTWIGTDPISQEIRPPRRIASATFDECGLGHKVKSACEWKVIPT